MYVAISKHACFHVCGNTHAYNLRTGNYRARLSCLQGALGTCLISLSAVVIVESDEDTV